MKTKKLDSAGDEGKADQGGSASKVASSEVPTLRADDAAAGEPAEAAASSEVPTVREDVPAGSVAAEQSSEDKPTLRQPDEAAPTDERPTVPKAAGEPPAADKGPANERPEPDKGPADEEFPPGGTVVPADGPMRVPRTLVSGGDEAPDAPKGAPVTVIEARASATPALRDPPTGAEPPPPRSLVKPLVATLAIVFVLGGLWLLTRHDGSGGETAGTSSTGAWGAPPAATHDAGPGEQPTPPSGPEGRDAEVPGAEGPTGTHHPAHDAGAALPPGWPTGLPTVLPTALPTVLPTAFPTALPTAWPTGFPTAPPKTTSTAPKTSGKP